MGTALGITKPPWEGTGEQHRGHTQRGHPERDAVGTGGRAGSPCCQGSLRDCQKALLAWPQLSRAGGAGGELRSASRCAAKSHTCGGHAAPWPRGGGPGEGHLRGGAAGICSWRSNGLGRAVQGELSPGNRAGSVQRQSCHCLCQSYRRQASVNLQSLPTWRVLEGVWNVWSRSTFSGSVRRCPFRNRENPPEFVQLHIQVQQASSALLLEKIWSGEEEEHQLLWRERETETLRRCRVPSTEPIQPNPLPRRCLGGAGGILGQPCSPRSCLSC